MKNVLVNRETAVKAAAAIKATEVTMMNRSFGINIDKHAVMTKKVLGNNLHNWSTVYRMVTVFGMGESGLNYTVNNAIGGNSPIARSFTKRSSVMRRMNVVQTDELGRQTYRPIVCGGDTVGNGMRYDYSTSMVLVKFQLDGVTDEQKQKNEALIARIISEGLSIKSEGEMHHVVIGAADVEGYERCNALVWSPSNERACQIIMTTENPESAWNKLEMIGGKSFNRIICKNIAFSKFQKLASRMGLFSAPAVPFAKIGNAKHGLLLIDDKILGSDDFNKEVKGLLSSIGVNIDNNTFDGAFWFTGEWAQEGFANLGLELTLQQAIMFAMQIRVNFVYAKVFGESLTKMVMNKLAKVLMKKYASKCKVVGNANNISMILDSNGAKLLDLDMELPEEGIQAFLLDIAKGTKSATSAQMVDKYGAIDLGKTRQLIRDLAKADGMNHANQIGDFSSGILDENNIDVYKELVNIAKNSGEGSAISNKVFSDQYLHAKLMKEVVKKQESAVKKCRVGLESLCQRALFEMSHILTDGKIDSLLTIDERGAIECYSTDVLERNREAIAAIENSGMSVEEQDLALRELLTANVVKYPTPGREEIELVVFLTEKQIKRRIAALVEAGIIDSTDGKVLFQYFATTSYGTIKFAPVDGMKNKLAGMDTDYDGVVVIFEKELVQMIVEEYAKKAQAHADNTGEVASNGGACVIIEPEGERVNYSRA